MEEKKRYPSTLTYIYDCFIRSKVESMIIILLTFRSTVQIKNAFAGCDMQDTYVNVLSHSVFCVTGGNSVSSSNRNPPFGGDSVAAAISWNFSDSINITNKKCTKSIYKGHINKNLKDDWNGKVMFQEFITWGLIWKLCLFIRQHHY